MNIAQYVRDNFLTRGNIIIKSNSLQYTKEKAKHTIWLVLPTTADDSKYHHYSLCITLNIDHYICQLLLP